MSQQSTDTNGVGLHSGFDLSTLILPRAGADRCLTLDDDDLDPIGIVDNVLRVQVCVGPGQLDGQTAVPSMIPGCSWWRILNSTALSNGNRSTRFRSSWRRLRPDRRVVRQVDGAGCGLRCSRSDHVVRHLHRAGRHGLTEA